MMKNRLHKIVVVVFALLCGLFYTGCSEDNYTKIKDLFQPRLIDDPQVTLNKVSLVWYKVNDAVSYTVEVTTSSFSAENLFTTVETKDPYVVLDDIPYATTFYIRVRSNAQDPVNNSQWTETSAATEARPAYAKIVENVSKTEIKENSAVIRWQVDPDNPVDSISVMPAQKNDTVRFVSRYLTAEEIAKGSAEVEGLDKNTIYVANVYDTTKPRTYDKPYNQVQFRTAGPSAISIIIGLEDDFNAILTQNNSDPEIPEGTEYYLPAGSYYTISPVKISKGFKIVGSYDGPKPILQITSNWGIQNGVYISNWEFENIEFQQGYEILNKYFFNTSSTFTIENVSFVNCDFTRITRGFWRHQGATSKHIMNFEMEGCTINQCGWQGSCYGTFAIGSDNINTSYDQFDNVSFRNCTFCNDQNLETGVGGWGNVFSAANLKHPIHLEYKNVTFYHFCRNSQMIDIRNAEGSEFVMEGVVIASPCGRIYNIGANTTTSFSNNYTTKDYQLGGKDINATDLDIYAADLYADPVKADFTINDATSPIVVNRSGDTRWLK